MGPVGPNGFGQNLFGRKFQLTEDGTQFTAVRQTYTRLAQTLQILLMKMI